MSSNIDAVLERGERLDLLIDKSDHLSSDSITFRQQTRQVRRQMWWEDVKMKVAVVVVAVALLYALVSWGCGGPLWPKCV